MTASVPFYFKYIFVINKLNRVQNILYPHILLTNLISELMGSQRLLAMFINKQAQQIKSLQEERISASASRGKGLAWIRQNQTEIGVVWRFVAARATRGIRF